MRAVVWHGRGDLRIDEVAEPPVPGPGQAVVEVAYCGICGTDLHEYREGPVMIRNSPHPLTGCSPPLALGHEFSGRVAATGDNVDVPVGTRVTVDPCWRCGSCYWCVRGNYHLCRVGGVVGLASPGALAPLVTVPGAGLIPTPHGVDDQVAALTEPVAVALHAVGRGQVSLGDHVVIQGFGPIGAAVLLAVRACGASAVWVSEPDGSRRSYALGMGATDAFDPSVCDLRRELRQRTEGVGVDVAFECSGVSQLLGLLTETVRRGGRIVVLGVGHGSSTLEMNRIVLFEREIVGAIGYVHDLPRVVEMVANGVLEPASLVTRIIPFDRAIEDGFQPLRDGTSPGLKTLVDVRGANGASSK